MGFGFTVFDWAIKKFSEYEVDDGFVAKFNTALAGVNGGGKRRTMPNKSQLDILMIPKTDLEIKVIKKFVKKNKQDRFLQFISTSKNRKKFINSLAHFDDFEWTLFKEVSKNQEQTILEALQKNKITTTNCYIISEDTELDTQIMEVTKAIHEVIGQSMGTILVFGDAEIIYYEGEGMKSRYISNRLVAL